jgi:hypothetical protein
MFSWRAMSPKDEPIAQKELPPDPYFSPNGIAPPDFR